MDSIYCSSGFDQIIILRAGTNFLVQLCPAIILATRDATNLNGFDTFNFYLKNSNLVLRYSIGDHSL